MAYPTPSKRGAVLARIRGICLALPETSERPSHGAPSFFVREKKCFLMLLDNHHDDGRFAIWCAAPPGNQSSWLERTPTAYSGLRTSGMAAGSASP